MDGRFVCPTTEPLGAPRVLPQTTHQLPTRPRVIAAKQSARNGAGPKPTGLICAASLKRPDLFHARTIRLLESWASDLFPISRTGRQPMQLRAEMAEVQCCVEAAIASVMQQLSHRVADEVVADRQPLARSLASQLE